MVCKTSGVGGGAQSTAEALESQLSEVREHIESAFAGTGSVLVLGSDSAGLSASAVIAYTMHRLGIGREEALRRVERSVNASGGATIVQPSPELWRMLGRYESKILATWTEDNLPPLDVLSG